MAPKKGKKKAALKKKTAKPATKRTTSKKPAKKKNTKKVIPATGLSPTAKPGLPCICIENEEGWFCMKRLPNGSLKECDGPFGTQEECQFHTCNK